MIDVLGVSREDSEIWSGNISWCTGRFSERGYGRLTFEVHGADENVWSVTATPISK